MFWSKPKKVVVNCFVNEFFSYVKEYAPIQPAHKFYPDWWKNLKVPEYDQHMSMQIPYKTNMKFCSGFVENFKHGFILPLWSDMSLIVDETNSYRYQFADGRVSLDHHNNEQAKGFYENYIFLKIDSPWLLESEQKDLKFMYNSCMWNHKNPPPYITPSGILDFTYNKSTNVFMLVEKKPQDIFVHFGQPMVHFIPLTDKNVVLNCEVLSNSEYNKKLSGNKVFTFQPRNVVNRKRITQGKCPIKTILKKSNDE